MHNMTLPEGAKQIKRVSKSKALNKNKKHVTFDDQSFVKHKNNPQPNTKKNMKKGKKNTAFQQKKFKASNSETPVVKTENQIISPKRKNDNPDETSPSKKMKLYDVNFKKRKKIRKQMEQNDKFDVIKTLKQIWEDLRREDCNPDKKKSLLKQASLIIKGRVKDFIYAHDTVRILETVFAEGTEDQRGYMFDEIKDDIVPLAKLKYSKYFLFKVLRYGTKIQKAMIMHAFQGHVTKLMRHSEAAEVVETAFNECANSLQRFQMVQEFYGASYRFFKESEITNLAELLAKKPETKPSVIASMKEELLKVLEKSVVKHSLIHHVLLQFFLNCDAASRTELIEAMNEVVTEILHTKEGSRVAMHCVWHGTANDRKAIVKHMKTFVKKIAMEEFGHMVLLALFDCVDDTLLIKKIIIKELIENIFEISENLHGKKVLIYLLNPRDPHFFHPDIINILKHGDNNETSKKDPEKRREELKEAIAGPLTQLIVDKISGMYRNNAFCLFTTTILKHAVGDKKAAYESISRLAVEPLSSDNKNTHVIENSGSYFMLKQLVLRDRMSHKENENSDSVSFSEVLVSTVPSGVMKSWFQYNRGAFLLLSLIETEIPAVVNKVKEEMTGCRKHLNKLSFKGAELLLKKLREFLV